VNIKKLFEQDFNKLLKMTIKEYTLYRGWHQIHHKTWSTPEKQRMWEVKQSLWMPEQPEDYQNIHPIIIPVVTPDQNLTWNILRIFTHSAHWNANKGRIKRFIVMNKSDLSYLGIISLGSDFISLKPRDEHIGWDRDARLKKFLRYTAMGSSISPTQPLGFNYVGGKLIALLVCSKPVIDTWNSYYNKETLLGITTTSLYGGFSQYTRLKHWKKCGTSEGKILMEPSDDIYNMAREEMKKLHPDKVREIYAGSRPKGKLLSMIYSNYKVRPPSNNAPRGSYWCKLYTKTNEYLRGETEDFGEPLFDNNVNTLTDLWKERYAKNRLKNMIDKAKYNKDSLFYDDLIKLSWEETKEKYLRRG